MYTKSSLQTWHNSILQDCTLCARCCHVNRLAGEVGYCGQDGTLRAARASLHYWEEPCISGTVGSGTVFFSGCSLRCAFCQNHDIAIGRAGQEVTSAHLVDIFLSLQAQGAANINLVTPTHFIPQIALALIEAKRQGLTVPIVYNTGSYETPDALRHLKGLVDIYLPDLKYYSAELSAQLSHTPDYFAVASAAIEEMVRQVGEPVLDEDSGLMNRGVIVRHLVLPGQNKDSKKLLRYLHETYGDRIYISILNQYTPLPALGLAAPFDRRVTDEEYAKILSFAEKLGIERGFMQEGEVADESFIPAFDGRGL